MAVNPCCMPLQRGVILMAVIDIILDILNLVTVTLLLVNVTVNEKTLDIDVTENEKTISIIICVLMLVAAICHLLLSIRLYFGAKKRDAKNCRIWLIVTIIITIINALSTIVNTSAGENNTWNLVVTIAVFVYRVYMMYVVYCFILEIKMDHERLGFQARLEGGTAYTIQMQTYPQPQTHPQQYPPVQQYPGFSQPQFQPHNNPQTISGTVPAPPPYPYPAKGDTATSNGGLYNANNSYYATNNV